MREIYGGLAAQIVTPVLDDGEVRGIVFAAPSSASRGSDGR